MSNKTIKLITFTMVTIPSPARGQGVLFEIDSSLQNFGVAVARAGDLDGDGFGDFAVSSPDSTVGAAPNAGAVLVYSAISGAIIRTYTNGVANEFVGYRSLADGDVDGDGVADLVAAAAGNDLGEPMFGAGKVFVYSGLTGQKLFGTIGPHKNAGLGGSVACLGDVDLDGVPDFAAGAFGELTFGPGPSGQGAGAIRVYSGSSGALIKHFSGSDLLSTTGAKVRAIGDVNQDGRADIMYSMAKNGSMEVFEIVSGASLAPLGTIPGDDVSTHHPDVDGDGVGDPIIREPVSPFRAVVYSGRSLQPLLYSQYFGTRPGDGLNDIDFDGHDDYVTFGSVNGKTSVLVMSGADGGLLRSDLTIGGGKSEMISFGDVNGDGRFDFGYGYISSATVFVHSSVCGKTVSYGAACPPTSGATPSFTITDSCPTPGGIWNMTLFGPPGTALLFVGAQPAAAYIGGGCQLLVGPPATVFPIPFAFGFSILNTKLPLTSPVGKLYLQLFTPDATKPWGYAASKGLEVSIE